MLDGLKLDYPSFNPFFFPRSIHCILKSKQASVHKDAQLLQYCNLPSHDNAASQPETHPYVMDCRKVVHFRFVVSQPLQASEKKNILCVCMQHIIIAEAVATASMQRLRSSFTLKKSYDLLLSVLCLHG